MGLALAFEDHPESRADLFPRRQGQTQNARLPDTNERWCESGLGNVHLQAVITARFKFLFTLPEWDSLQSNWFISINTHIYCKAAGVVSKPLKYGFYLGIILFWMQRAEPGVSLLLIQGHFTRICIKFSTKERKSGNGAVTAFKLFSKKKKRVVYENKDMKEKQDTQRPSEIKLYQGHKNTRHSRVYKVMISTRKFN